MKHLLTISLLFSTLAHAPIQSSEESTACEQSCFNTDGDFVGTIGEPIFTMQIGTIAVEVYSVEADGTVHGIIPINEDTATLTEGTIIGTIGGETYRVESIEPTEDGEHFEIVLKI